VLLLADDVGCDNYLYDGDIDRLILAPYSSENDVEPVTEASIKNPLMWQTNINNPADGRFIELVVCGSLPEAFPETQEVCREDVMGKTNYQLDLQFYYMTQSQYDRLRHMRSCGNNKYRAWITFDEGCVLVGGLGIDLNLSIGLAIPGRGNYVYVPIRGTWSSDCLPPMCFESPFTEETTQNRAPGPAPSEPEGEGLKAGLPQLAGNA